jgi:hypothetical protein
MFEHDHSSARGEMASRRVIAFKHSSALGNASAHKLFDRVIVQRRFNGDLYPIGDERLDNAPKARCYEDYEVEVRRDGLPEGIVIYHRQRPTGVDGREMLCSRLKRGSMTWPATNLTSKPLCAWLNS